MDSPETGSASTTGTGTGSCPEQAIVTEDGCFCGEAESACMEGQFCDASTSTCVDPVCTTGSVYAPGTSSFSEQTETWGLVDLGVEGVRLSVLDFDGDGWPDLFVRRGGVVVDDFAGGVRHIWLLRNVDGLQFEDVTESSGILARRDGDASRGRPVEVVVSADVDGDGDIDVYTGVNNGDAAAEGETSELMLNQGDGTFALTAPDHALRRQNTDDAPAGAAFVDVNRDGFVDLWLAQHQSQSGGVLQDRLYYGDGKGAFFEGTILSGLETEPWGDLDLLDQGLAHSRAWGAAACDLNGDGWPELLAPSYGRSPNHLWQGAPHASEPVAAFTNRSVASGYAFDDNLTWTDNQFAACYCQENPDAEDCDQAISPSISCGTPNWNHAQDRRPFRLGGNSGATICADFDNDGAIDLWTTEIRHWWAGEGSDHSELLHNTGEGDVLFERPGREALGLDVPHLTTSWDEGIMSGTALDFDNDGWLDLYLGGSDYPGNRGLLYHQGSPLDFTLVATEDTFEHNRSHGVAAADFDRDGDIDLIVGHSRARCDAGLPNDCYETQQIRMFENVLGENGNWIQLSLEASDTNTAAIGARVSVSAAGIVQTQEVGGGFGHYGAQNDLTLHLGLAEACTAEITIRWPDADLTEESFLLPAGHRFRIRQGGTVEVH